MTASAASVQQQELREVAQPLDPRRLSAADQALLPISQRKVGQDWVVVSRYADDVWWLTGLPTNVEKASTKLDFRHLPPAFRAVAKAMLYRLKTRGRDGRKPSAPSSMVTIFARIRLFLTYVAELGIDDLSLITPMTCATYLQACKALRSGINKGGGRSAQAIGTPLSPASLNRRLVAVEMIYEMSQYTDAPMPHHPWRDTSADALSRYGHSRRSSGNSTPLMTDHIFTTLFQRAWSIVQAAEAVLDVRDELDALAASCRGYSSGDINMLKVQAMKRLGWEGGGGALVASLIDIRTACYVVVASLSGCRNQEVMATRSKSYYRTEDDSGQHYWWMRSRSTKTAEGNTEWMVPEAAVTALQVMDRWAAPHQVRLREQIDAYREADPSDVRIAEADDHLDAIFVGVDKASDSQVRTLSLTQLNISLKLFCKSCGLEWRLASHQFRRKFANYAAHSRFGDLRYLREHFKHWSMDMTIGYALNESQEMALYLEIEDELSEIKQQVVTTWVDKEQPLAGGYGSSLVDWRSHDENITLFKTRGLMMRSIAESTAIRSNGHAWCTADDNVCDGNDVDTTRCEGCGSAVIGRQHAPIYVGLYNELRSLRDLEDIGEGGRARVQRDLSRCRAVLTRLGHDPLETAA